MGSVNLDYLATGKHTSLDLAIGMALRDFSSNEQDYLEADEILEAVQKIYGQEFRPSEEERVKDASRVYMDKCQERKSRYLADIDQQIRMPRAIRIQRIANIWLRKKNARVRVEYVPERDAYTLAGSGESVWCGPNGLAGNCNIFEFLPPHDNFFPLVLMSYYARHDGMLKFRFSCVFVHADGEVSFTPRWGTMRREGFTWIG